MQPALTPTRRRLRRALRLAMGVVAAGVIGMAVVLAAAATAVPWVVEHPERVREFLSERVGRPVDFASLQGRWTRGGPVFVLREVAVTPPGGGEPFRIDSAELAIDFYAWARRGVSFSEFRVVGIDVEAERGADGSWRIARLGGPAGADVDIDGLLDLVGIDLRGARVRVRDPARGIAVDLARLDLRVSDDLGGRRVGGVAWIDAGGEPLRFACVRGAATECWVGGRDVEAERWLRATPLAGIAPVAGRLDADLWLGVGERLDRVRVELRARDLVLRGTRAIPFSSGIEVEPRTQLPFLRIAARWQREGEGWRTDWLDWRRDGDAGPDTRAVLRRAEPGAPVEVRASRLALAAAAPLAALSDRFPDGLRRVLYENTPGGALTAVALDFRDGRATGTLRLDRVRLAVGSRTPGIDAVSGTLRANDGVFLLEPDPGLAVTLDYPHVFRRPIALRLHEGTVGIWRDDEGAHVEATDLRFEGDGFAGRGRAHLRFDGQGRRPWIDAMAWVDHGEVARAGLFWPVNAMPAQTVAWLDRALVAGRVEQGAAQVHGDLDDWPFRAATGRFDARARVRDVDLDYHPRWPAARIDVADCEFTALSLAANTDSARVMGNRVQLAHASIDSFKDPLLRLHVEGDGTGPQLMALLRTTPVMASSGGYLAGIEVGGRADVAFDLDLPLKAGLGTPRLFGTARLHEADLADRHWRLDFGRAHGGLRFSDRGFAADDLAVSAAGDPAALSVAIGEFATDPAHLVEASLRGELPLSTVLAGVPDAALLLPRAPGRSEWNIELAVDRAVDGGAPPRRTVRLASDLRGTALELPAPLRKDADSALPLSLSVDLPVAGSELALDVGHLLRLRARLPAPGQPLAATVAFGVAEPGRVPASGLKVRGDVPALDLGGWAALGGGDAGPAVDVDLQAAELAVLGRAFADAQVRIAAEDDGRVVHFEGPQILGGLRLPPPGSAAGVTAEFERLHLPDATPSAPSRSVDPAALPALHLWIKDLRLGDAQLGDARIETFPVAGGMRIEQFETRSPVVALDARGEWTLIDGIERSRFGISFTSENLGRMLDALGFAGMVDGGQTIARIDGEWRGSPAQFGLQRIAGTLSAKIGQGRILDVNPGAGRLLGLVSLQAIPRRLALDFSDFFRSGMSFDSIEGQFALRTGDAFTTDLAVKGPAADIIVSGRTGLTARDYDQELQVTPKVGGVLPVVGALAAGPIGAAAGLVAQGVLRSPLDQMARARYRVTGSWDKPDIQLIQRERGGRPETERNG
jgi:uncharacterized protein (TIGR02099 family)